MAVDSVGSVEGITSCFICGKPQVRPEAWTVESLRFIRDSALLLCQDHAIFCQTRIEILEKKEVKEEPVAIPASFVPTPAAKKDKNFYEREPGEEG